MKKPIFYILLLLMTPILSLAQNIDNETYQEAVDYVNCKLAELSVKNQIERPHYASFQQATQGCDIRVMNQDFYDNVLKNFFVKRNLGGTQILVTSVNTIKVNSNNRPNYDAERLASYLVDTLLRKSQRVQRFIQKHQTSYYSLEGQMRTAVMAHFRGSTPQIENSEDTEDSAIIDKDINSFDDKSDNNYINNDGGEQANSEMENDILEDQRDNSVFDEEEDQTFFQKNRTILLLSLITIGFILYYMNKRGATFSGRGNGTDGERTRLATPEEFNQLREEISLMRHQTNSLEEDMNRLKFKFASLEEKLGVTPTDEPIETDLLLEEETETEPVEEDVVIDLTQDTDTDDIVFNFDDVNQDAIDDSIDTSQSGIGHSFFMAIPDENGIFDSSFVSETFKRPISVYLFTITSKDGNQAEFSIHEDIATMIRALDNFDEYLRPACKSNAILHKNATKIVTESKGLAIREGNRWRVIEKANIHYA